MNEDQIIKDFKYLKSNYYSKIEESINEILDKLNSNDDLIISHRYKEENSLIAKVLYRGFKLPHPMLLEDKLGFRVITKTLQDLNNLIPKIENELSNSENKIIFDVAVKSIDEKNYAAKHIILKPKKQNDIFEGLNNRDKKKTVDRLKVEIQVKTQIQDVVSSISHDNIYKGYFKDDIDFNKEFNRIFCEVRKIENDLQRLAEKMRPEIIKIESFINGLNSIKKEIDGKSFVLQNEDKVLSREIFKNFIGDLYDFNEISNKLFQKKNDISEYYQTSSSFFSRQPISIFITYLIISGQSNVVDEKWEYSMEQVNYMKRFYGYSSGKLS